jgi:hypothetical protein
MVAVFAFIGLRYGAFDRTVLRDALGWLRQVGGPLVTMLGEACTEHAQTRRALHIVEPHGKPTLEQAAAAHLARRGRQLTPSELLRDNFTTTAKVLKAAMDEHPAFVRLPNGLYGVGHPIEHPPTAGHAADVRSCCGVTTLASRSPAAIPIMTWGRPPHHDRGAAGHGRAELVPSLRLETQRSGDGGQLTEGRST